MYLEKVKTSSKRYMQPNVHSALFTIANTGVSLVAQMVKNPPAMWETWVQPLGWEDPPGGGHGNPLQYSCLENSMDCTVHGVAKSWTWMSDFHFTEPYFPFLLMKTSPFFLCCCSVAQSCQTLWLHGLQPARLLCPLLSPGVWSNWCPLSWWCQIWVTDVFLFTY